MKSLSKAKRGLLALLSYLSVFSSFVLLLNLFLNIIYREIKGKKYSEIEVYVELALLLIILLYSIFSSKAFKKDKMNEEFIVQDIPDGQLRISLKVIESIVKACVDKHENLKLVSQKLVSVRNQLEVSLQLDVSGTEPIPVIAERLKKELVSSIAHSTGIDSPIIKIEAGVSDSRGMEVGKTLIENVELANEDKNETKNSENEPVLDNEEAKKSSDSI